MNPEKYLIHLIKITKLDNSIRNNEEIGKINIYHEDNLLNSVIVKFDKKYLVKESKDYKNILIFIGICLLGLIVFIKKR